RHRHGGVSLVQHVLSSDADHRHLHSCPTRRSSDLGPEGRERQEQLVLAARAAGMRVVGPNCLGVANTDPRVSLNATLSPHLPPRSEEHTSELQSRENLVCRLLLEKKKTTVYLLNLS